MFRIAEYLDRAQMAECRAAAATTDSERATLLALAVMWRRQADIQCGMLAAQAPEHREAHLAQ